MRKFKMSSLIIITKKKSIAEQEININKLRNHNSLAANDKNYQENKSITVRKSGQHNTLQRLKKKIILKT